MSVDEITGIEADTITTHSIYLYRQRGFDSQGRVVGYFTATGSVPKFVEKLRERGIEVDMALFEPAPEEKDAVVKKRRRSR
jgi:pilus assembly protein CpaF